MSVRLLAIDTATEACSCVLWVDGQQRARFEVVGRSHTQKLMPMVQSLMDEAGLAYAQIDVFGCGIGPGSFAGVRIGTGFIKGLALALDRPVVVSNSLEAMAQARINQGHEHVVAAIDARMEEIYFGCFSAGPERRAQACSQLQVLPPTEATLPVDAAWAACGSAWQTYGQQLSEQLGIPAGAVDAQALPDVAEVVPQMLSRYGAGQFVSADELAPLYLRNKVALTLDEQVALRKSRAES